MSAVHRLVAVALLMVAITIEARADDLVLYGAGSLREAMAQIATSFGHAHGVTIATQFGPSGRMRERIEKGEHVDVFTSADVGHARKLVDDGRASVMAVFARNTVCLLSPAAFGATTDTALDRLLAPGVRVGVSPPKIDPLGDYTVRLFDIADRLRAGSGATLQARAVVLDTPPGSPPPKSGDADADEILSGRVDASIVYCSGRDRYARLLPDAHRIPTGASGWARIRSGRAERCAPWRFHVGADDFVAGRPEGSCQSRFPTGRTAQRLANRQGVSRG